MDAVLIVVGTVLLTAWFARLLHRRVLRRRLAEYGRGHARLRELEADLRVAGTRHEVELERMRRERDALADERRRIAADIERLRAARERMGDDEHTAEASES